jgi:hypothetical protein
VEEVLDETLGLRLRLSGIQLPPNVFTESVPVNL